MQAKSLNTRLGSGLALVLLVSASVSAFAQSADTATKTKHTQQHHVAASTSSEMQLRASQDGPFPEHVTKDGVITGPIPRSADSN
jgi:hypothetical protein